jgi:hypothetical protein
MDAEIVLKLLFHRVAVKSKHSLFSAPLKSRMFMSEFNKDFWYVYVNLFFEDCEAKSESRKEERKKGRKEDIERSKVADSDNEH